jgi:hypothetical protein
VIVRGAALDPVPGVGWVAVVRSPVGGCQCGSAFLSALVHDATSINPAAHAAIAIRRDRTREL